VVSSATLLLETNLIFTILHDFCYSWKLKVNTDKSRIMVFNSNGKTYLNQFSYNIVDIETVANYCYLGMVLKFNGNFN
jgi:hypothetical protein